MVNMIDHTNDSFSHGDKGDEVVCELERLLEEKEKLVREQLKQIEQLQDENKVLKEERDALLCEVNKLKFELDMSELTRLGEDNTPQKPDRPPCGPGPPLKQLKSYSVDTGSPPTPPNQRARQRSVSGNTNSRKYQCRSNEEILKRSRVQTAYELSQDLLDKQVEMLERKYGGHVRASKAALTIQRAFRRYCMFKKFQYLTSSAKTEKRLSRRFNTVDVANGDDSWGYYVSSSTTVKYTSNMAPAYDVDHLDAESVIKSNFAALYKELNETLEASASGPQPGFRPVRSLSLREKYPMSSSDRISMDPRSQAYGSLDAKDLNGNCSLPRCGSRISNCANAAQRLRTNLVPSNIDLCNSESDFSDKDVSLMEESTYYMPLSTMSPPVLVRNVGWPVQNGGKARAHTPVVIANQLASPVDEHYLTGFHSPHDSIADDSIITTQEEHHIQLSRDTVLRRTIASSPVENAFMKSRNQQKFLPCIAHKTIDLSARRNSAPPTDLRKRVPPEVPKRTSSITTKSMDGRPMPKNMTEGGSKSDLVRSPDGGSLSSVQSSGSESSLTGSGSDRATPSGKNVDINETHGFAKGNVEASPVWKRKSQVSIVAEHLNVGVVLEDKRLSNISENSEDSLEGTGYSSSPTVTEVTYSSRNYQAPCLRVPNEPPMMPSYKVSEVIRKRQYRVGLNLFNKKPEKGVKYLIQRGFLEHSPQAVARFLISRKGLSKQMIGEYLGNLQNSFNMEVLDYFAGEMDLAGMQVDVALRKFQTYFRMPGEAQKIERLMEVFGQHYCECNHEIVNKLQSPDTIFILAFAIIMLNTDLHTPNLKPERRMKLDDFIKNLRGIDDGHDLSREMLVGIYERIKSSEFRPGADHVTQVMKVQQTIVGKKPNLALPHRRLVCYCRLYEVNDVHKKERQGLHQREVFLFNDVLVVTKIFSKKKNSVTYTFRQSFPLVGMQVQLFEVPYYPHGIQLVQKVGNKLMITFNARNEHDRCKFVEDLRESIYEMDEMENIRIETELEKQKLARNRASENRDSGVADMEIPNIRDGRINPECNLKRSALSNSLLDIHEQSSEKPQRRGSAGSLDSGMSISFQSSAASTVSRDSSPQQAGSKSHGKPSSHQSFLGGLFGKRGKNTSKAAAKPNEASDA